VDALILAAGLGTRLGALTSRERPKALLPVGGKPLLDHVLDRLGRLDAIERAVVVTGYGRDQVLAHLEQGAGPLPLTEAFNSEYEAGNFFSLLRGLEEVGSAWVLMNVDHIYPLALLEQCLARAAEVSAVCDRDRTLTPDCMKVRSSGTPPRVSRISKELASWDWGYIGMTIVTPEGRSSYLQAVDELRTTGERDLRAEAVLQALADRGRGARILDASGFGWLEVDDPEDRERAERRLREGFEERDRSGEHARTSSMRSDST